MGCHRVQAPFLTLDVLLHLLPHSSKVVARMEAFVGLAVQVGPGMSAQLELCGKGCLLFLVMQKVPIHIDSIFA